MLDFLIKLLGKRSADSPTADAPMRAALADAERAETGFRQSEEQFAQLVSGVEDYAVFLLDRAGNVLTWNAGAERIKGYTAAEIIGRHFSIFYPREVVEQGWPDEELRRAAADGRIEDEGWRLRKDGSRFWAIVVITALRDRSGAVRGYLKITRDLTERKQSEEALRQSEERFRLLIEGAQDYAIFMLDADGRIASWNPGAERIKGYKAEEIIGQHLSRFYPQEAIDRGWPDHELKVARETGRFEDEGWRVRKDGTQFWANVVITALHDGEGNFRGFSKITRDLTERKQAEESARRLVEETTARRVAEEDARLIQAQRERLRVTLASIGDAVISTDAEGRVEFLNPVAEALVGWRSDEAAQRSLEEVFRIVNEDSRRPVENPALRALTEGTIVGLANHTVLISKDGSERPIDDSAAPIRDAEGHVFGSVLVFRDVTEKKRAQQRLREQQEWLRVTLSSIGDAVIATDTEGRVTFLNPVAEKLTGYSKVEAQGQPLEAVFVIVNEETRRPVEHPVQKVLRGGAIVGLANHTVLIARDGSEWPIDDSAAPIRDAAGRLIGVVMTFRDVTEHRRAEAALRKSEAESRRLLAFHEAVIANMGEGLYAVDTDGLVTYVNPAAEDLFGWKRAELQGRRMHDITHYKHPDGTPFPIEECAGFSVLHEQRPLRDFNDVFIRKDGTFFPVVYSSSPLVTDDKVSGLVVVFRDMTERNRAEAALRQSEQELADFFDNATVGLHWVGPDGTILRVNRAELDLLGYREEEYVGHHIAEFHADQDVIADILRRLHAGEKLKEYPARMVCKDGSLRDVVIDSSVLWRDGQFVHTRCFTRDVTERKLAEARAREQEQRNRTILESITDAFCALDRDWRFIYVNRQAEVLLGQSRADLIGKSHWDVYPDTIGTDLERQYRRAVAENVTVTLENYYPPHDRWYEVHAYPSAEGLSIYFRDVSERKRAEAALRESEQKFRLMADTIPQLAWMARPDGYIFWYNRRWYEYTGTTPEQMEGWGWQSVQDPKTLPHVLERWNRCIERGESLDMVFPLKGADGEFRPFLTRVNPLRDDKGRILYWFGTNTDISEIKRAEEDRRESERRFRQLADAMPQIVWSAGPDGKIDYLNGRWTEYTGLPDTVSNESWAQFLRPDEAQTAGERWAACVASGAPFEMELRLLDQRQQTYRWHLLRTVPVHDDAGRVARWFGTATDINEQKRAEESARFLAEASAALAGIVDYESTLQSVASLAVPYFADWSAADVAAEDGKLRRLAVAHQDPAKVELAHQLARDYPPDPDASAGAFAVLRTREPALLTDIPDEMLVRSAKDQRHLNLIRSLGLKSYICVPLVVSGRALGVFTFATAESGRRYGEADLALAMDLAHRAAVAIENTQLYQALRETDRRKDEFLATLAHELRNPLAPILNSLQILKLPRLDTESAERSRAIVERQAQHLARLVDDLLDVSRVMRGKIELRKERVELAAVVARAVETVQPLVDSKGHQLLVHISPESLPLDADPVRLTQAVGNLLTNAAKYTEPNGRILLTAEREGDTAVLRVRDKGIGIAPDMLPHVFELFVQADHSAARSQGGLGIGLTLVKNLIEMHNGTVEAKSEGLERGSEFVVRLPLSAHDAGESQVHETGPQLQEAPSRSGNRLLVVDDNQDAANSLAMLLEFQGHEVRAVYSGAAALQVATSFRPDAVFLDIGMPGMDGYEVARRLRRIPGIENTVLAALTGWGQQEDRRRTAEAGFNHHLVKPPDEKALAAVIAGLKRDDN